MEAVSNMLPSDEMYAPFKERSTCLGRTNKPECDAELIERVRVALKARQINDENFARNIVKNWYYACMKGNNPAYYDPCYFFYYWLGTEIITKKRGSHNFTDIMKAAYAHLDSSKCTNKCTNIYDDVGEHVFKQSKIFFDSFYNYSIMARQQEENTFPRCQKLNQGLTGAKEAYDRLCEICDSSNDKCCTKFKQQHKTSNKCDSWNMQPLTCEDVSEEGKLASCTQDEENSCPAKLAKTLPKKGTPTLTKEHLERLNSYMLYYKQFKSNLSYCSYPCFPTKSIADKIKGYFTNEKYANVIGRALCYMYTKRRDNEFTDTNCKFFNFWLQHILSNELKKDTSPSTVIDTINTELIQIQEKHKCTLTDLSTTTTNNVSFEHRKTLFEFLTDHDKIMSQLGTSNQKSKPLSPTPSCSKKYKAHLDAIKSAYKDVYAKCHATNNACHIDFKELFTKVGSGNGTLTLECQQLSPEEEASLKEEGKEEEDELSSLLSKGGGDLTVDDDRTGSCNEQLNEMLDSFQLWRGDGTEATSVHEKNTAVPAISAALTTIALPAVVFYLYKYNLLPSWISNHFGGGSSKIRKGKKRSTTHHFNTLTEDDNDTSTTLYSTTDTSTTIGDDYTTTDDHSTIYNDESPRPTPSTRSGRGAGTYTAPNHRTNIRYHP
ncbi:KIR-like CYIR protein [Plasmodium coatneyi]|uniref:KIR-like CYIR protein n=1 Tax=Plasmodium coatneyi TaxID=208452 RepID=A0A1B1DXX2_9APIC|nr:KIR-like CYIR protein [Plasmodium coatneyi]ANQ07604.1 KIR-like CYIR protein [Plasmodium coatneyi]